MVRLKSAYIIRCEEVVKNSEGKPVEIRCTYVPESRSGSDTSGISVKGTLHWVSVAEAVPVEIRVYDRLFTEEDMGSVDGEFQKYLNPGSLKVLSKVYAEPAILESQPTERYQFLRMGYYCLDSDSRPDKLVFNQTVTLRDLWQKKG